jgi:soluble lytic murein transglycosylase
LRKRRSKKKSSRGCLLWAAIIILLVLFAGWRIWRSDFVQMHFVYMWPYQNEILTYSKKNDIDPFLVAAIIKNESAFNRAAISKAGAIGLMQLMPDTAEWIAGQMGLGKFVTQDLFRTDVNIRMGCWYVSELKHEFKNNMVLLMVAYNAGRGKTHTWMEENHWDYDFGDTNKIPYADTRKYVQGVLHDRDEFYRLYKEEVK